MTEQIIPAQDQNTHKDSLAQVMGQDIQTKNEEAEIANTVGKATPKSKKFDPNMISPQLDKFESKLAEKRRIVK